MRFGLQLSLLAVSCAGCATTRNETPIGAEHQPYPGKPLYMELTPAQRALNAYLRQRRGGNGTAPIHLSAPAPAEAAPVEAAPAEAAPAEASAPADAPQPGGSISVVIPEQAPQPNRVDTPEPQWQPTIITPGP